MGRPSCCCCCNTLSGWKPPWGNASLCRSFWHSVSYTPTHTPTRMATLTHAQQQHTHTHTHMATLTHAHKHTDRHIWIQTDTHYHKNGHTLPTQTPCFTCFHSHFSSFKPRTFFLSQSLSLFGSLH